MVIVLDLDDTLYNEIEFVKSGFLAVSQYIDNRDSKKYFNLMMEIFEVEGSGRVFNHLKEIENINISLEKMVEIYRFHMPNISLREDAKVLLEYLKGYKTALITDGHIITQQNKFRALGLDRYIKLPIFTDLLHTKKPDLIPFEEVMREFKDSSYLYIADNPKKDFIAPKKLNWRSIHYKNPIGIYSKYKDDSVDAKIQNLKEAIKYIKRWSDE